MPRSAAPVVAEWSLRRSWVLWACSGCVAWALACVATYAALGALDRLAGAAYLILSPFLFSVGAIWGQRLRVTVRGIEYVNALSRWSVDWADVEAVDRRHLTYTLGRETTVDTGLKISMDSLVRAAPRRSRRIPLRPFLDDKRYAALLQQLRQHRPDVNGPGDA